MDTEGIQVAEAETDCR